MSDLIRASLEGVKDFTDTESFVGHPIETPSGVTVIPVCRVSIGMATGGVDYGAKRVITPQNFGGGGGTGVSVAPVAFLTVDPAGVVQLIPVSGAQSPTASRVVSLIEQAPDLIRRIKDALS